MLWFWNLSCNYSINKIDFYPLLFKISLHISNALLDGILTSSKDIFSPSLTSLRMVISSHRPMGRWFLFSDIFMATPRTVKLPIPFLICSPTFRSRLATEVTLMVGLELLSRSTPPPDRTLLMVLIISRWHR